MKARTTMGIAALLVGASLVACGKSNEPSKADAARLEESAKKICEKITECTSEQLKALPPEQRKMAEAMIGNSKEACLGQYGASKAKSTGEKVEYTKEEMDLALKCMDAISNTACKDLMTPTGAPESCKQLQALQAKKGTK